MGCKLLEMCFLKAKRCRREGSRKALFCSVMIFWGLCEVLNSSWVSYSLLEEALPGKKERNSSGLWGEEKSEKWAA